MISTFIIRRFRGTITTNISAATFIAGDTKFAFGPATRQRIGIIADQASERVSLHPNRATRHDHDARNNDSNHPLRQTVIRGRWSDGRPEGNSFVSSRRILIRHSFGRSLHRRRCLFVVVEREIHKRGKESKKGTVKKKQKQQQNWWFGERMPSFTRVDDDVEREKR